jgi:uncharacterized 2Fe-2S/4Fe-4S cluster protein (DUF4445 family)
LDLGKGAYAHFSPNVAGYVGADHVAMILGTRLWKTHGVALGLDIGTNTEICLSNHGQMTSASCASGPAFEGAHIEHGMRAAAGAIERLRLVDTKVEYHTVDDSAPVGLCGSGALDALAQLYLAGIVDRSGRMADTDSRVRSQELHREFILVKADEQSGGSEITLTQQDVRELQLAKAAIRTGIEALLQDSHLRESDIDEVIIAGAFGSYIDVSSAIAIGMLPALRLDRFQQVGNAAGTGARLALISRAQRMEAVTIARRVRYLELASVPGFQDMFAQCILLGPYHPPD